jgi:hypothetical protein
MTPRLAALLLLGGLSACSSRSSESNVAYEKIFQENDRSPAKSAGWCTHCNMTVFEGHRCGRTVPCQLCKREVGSRHLHEVQWSCDRCQFVMAQQHECQDAKSCSTCRQDKRTVLGTLACERCYRQIPPTKIQGLTSYCGECNQEIGANHIHGKTTYCLVCLREAGSNHICGATRLCMDHQTEHSPDHVHGTTQYCDRCHRDCGVNHKHGETEWCWMCKSEVAWPHWYHN